MSVVDAFSNLVHVITLDRLLSRTLSTTKMNDVVANRDRPVDAISFLGNELWIIDHLKNLRKEDDAGTAGKGGDVEMLEMLCRWS